MREPVVYCLLAALAGGLAFVSNRQNEAPAESVIVEQHAESMVSYGKRLRTRVDNLKAMGCADNEISFENTVDRYYTNPNSPANRTCHVFGGADSDGLDWPDRYSGFPYGGSGWVARNADFVIGPGDRVKGVPQFEYSCDGSSCNDLLLKMYMSIYGRRLCIAINESLKIENPGGEPPVNPGYSHSGMHFRGDFPETVNIISAAELVSQPAGCFAERYPPEGYTFYSVLIGRGR